MKHNSKHTLMESILRRFPYRELIAVLTLFLIFGYLFYDRIYPSDRDNGDVRVAMITLATLILGYYFGSSKAKTESDERKDVVDVVKQPDTVVENQNVDKQNVQNLNVGKE